MRKFTKEITALFATAAIGATACAGTVSASEQPVLPDEPAACSEDYPPFAGGIWDIREDGTPDEEIPPLAGDIVEGNIPYEDILPPTAGTPLPGDENIDELYDEYIDKGVPTAGVATITDELVSEPDGDINDDGICDRTDMEALRKWILHQPDDTEHTERIKKADFNYDGVINAVDLSLFKQQTLIAQENAKIKFEGGMMLFSPAASTSGVVDFLKVLRPNRYNFGNCYNLTPFVITQEYGFRIFERYHALYLEYQGEIYTLDEQAVDWYDIKNFAIADLNYDGYFEIYYVYSLLHSVSSHESPSADWFTLGYFDTATCTSHISNYGGDVSVITEHSIDMQMTLQYGDLKIGYTYPVTSIRETPEGYEYRYCTYLHPVAKFSADDDEIGITYYPQYDEMYHDVKELDD